MSRPGIAELAKQVKAIKEKRGLSHAQVAQECNPPSGCGVYLTRNIISGLCHTHSLRPDYEPWVRNWVKKHG